VRRESRGGRLALLGCCSASMASHGEAVQQFMETTGADEKVAKFFVERCATQNAPAFAARARRCASGRWGGIA